MGLTIRPFIPDDYPSLAEVASAIHSEYPETADNIRHHDESRDKDRKFHRLVAETNGRVVGHGGYQDYPRGTNRFWVWAEVHPEYQGKGYGQALYEAVLESLKPFDPPLLRAETREDQDRGQRFLTDRGFTLEMRELESAIDMDSFDPRDYQRDVERAAKEGIVIKNYAQLKAETDDLDALQHRLSDLHWAIDQDIPSPDENVRTPHEEWVKRFDHPQFLAEGHIYALHGDRFVGGSMLWGRPLDKDLNTGMTGILREYRKKGIATALKIHALTYAKQYGAKWVRTQNEENNNGMLGINRRLGFQPQPAWLFLVKKLREETNGE